MKEYVVPFEHASIKELRNAIEQADNRERQGRRDGRMFEFLVSKERGMKIEIFANEHPPPHFRVKIGGDVANFRIDNCEPLNGDNAVLRRQREIKKWHARNRDALIETWNETRPSDCPVGEFRTMAFMTHSHTTADIHQEKIFEAHIVACLISDQGYIERDCAAH